MGEWRAALADLTPRFHRPMSLSATEEIEAELKALLRQLFRSPLTGDEARFLASWQRDLGFLLKYKPYGVKCATAFGYSLFLLNAGEGFSFQRHLTRKTEVFHILEPLEGALALVCTSAEWDAVYEPGRFQRWLHGAADAELDRLVRRPRAGDVYYVDELGVVHSVLGCVLEEFATVSTDMVDRLHDQNEGRAAAHVAREAVLARVRSLHGHAPRVPARDPASAGMAVRRGAARLYELASGTVEALRLHLERGVVDLPADARRVRVLFTVRGQSAIDVRAAGEAAQRSARPPLELTGGDLVMIPPGAAATIEAAESAAISIHGIEPEVALA